MTLLYSRGGVPGGWGILCKERIEICAGSGGHALGIERQGNECTRTISAYSCSKRVVIRVSEARCG